MTDESRPQVVKAKGSAARVREVLIEHGLAEEIVTFEQSTKTAQMAADAMGCELGQIVKSLVMVADGRPVVALVAGDRRGDASAIAAEVGATAARMADADTVREATGYAIGGVSPFALPASLIVLVDDSLERFDVVYPAAGTPQSMVRMPRQLLLDIAGGRVARISH
ncbi:MAG: YbaK/EbsC family protein [Coriobacteriia bacterium]|nr:YbaK/EbsC family protein [Coriobacteriia bacterium]